MQERIKEFAKICADTLPIVEPIYEFGAMRVSGQEDFNLRSYYEGYRYIGADMRSGLGVDVVLNLHKIDLPSESVGTLLCFETLEHVEYPWQALREIHRVLKKDGVFIMSVPFDIPIHAYPSDYWRYTPEGVKSLLQSFETVFVGAAGDEECPTTVVAVASKQSVKIDNSDFQAKYKRWATSWNNPLQRLNWRVLLKLLLPPILLGTWRELRYGRFWTRVL